MDVRQPAFPLSLRKCLFSEAVQGGQGRRTAGCQSRHLGFPFPFREANMGMDGVKLAALLMAKKESCTAKPLASCCLPPSAPGRSGISTFCRFPLVFLQRHLYPCACQVCCALRTLLKGHSFAFLFTCLSRMWWVSRTSLLGSPCPTFAPVELKLGVKYFPLPLPGKRLAVTQFPVWEMGITRALFARMDSK